MGRCGSVNNCIIIVHLNTEHVFCKLDSFIILVENSCLGALIVVISSADGLPIRQVSRTGTFWTGKCTCFYENSLS